MGAGSGQGSPVAVPAPAVRGVHFAVAPSDAGSSQVSSGMLPPAEYASDGMYNSSGQYMSGQYMSTGSQMVYQSGGGMGRGSTATSISLPTVTSFVRRPDMTSLAKDSRLGHLAAYDRWFLNFVDHDVEIEFRLWYLQQSTKRIARFLIASAMFLVFFTLVQLGEIALVNLAMRVVIFVAILVLVRTMSTAWYTRNIVRMHAAIMAFFTVAFAQLILGYRLDLDSEVPSILYPLGYLAAYGILRPGFRTTIAMCVAFSGAFVGVTFAHIEPGAALAWTADNVIVSFLLVPYCYFFFYNQRRTFLLQKTVARETKILSGEKSKTDAVLTALFPVHVAHKLRSRLAKDGHDAEDSEDAGGDAGSADKKEDLAATATSTASSAQLGVQSKKLAGADSTLALAHGMDLIADVHQDASFAFVRVIGFDSLVEAVRTQDALFILNELFKRLDRVCQRTGLEKIKTISEVYMVASGLNARRKGNPTNRLLHATLMMLDTMEQFQDNWQQLFPRVELPIKLSLRIGVHSGPCVAGVIGTVTPLWDCWGDSINTAARMETTGKAGIIQVSEAAHQACGEHFIFKGPFEVTAKGKGKMAVYHLTSERHAPRMPGSSGTARSNQGTGVSSSGAGTNSVFLDTAARAAASKKRDGPGLKRWTHRFSNSTLEDEYVASGSFLGSTSHLKAATTSLVLSSLLFAFHDNYVDPDYMVPFVVLRLLGAPLIGILARLFLNQSDELVARYVRPVFSWMSALVIALDLVRVIMVLEFEAYAIRDRGRDADSIADFNESVTLILLVTELNVHLSILCLMPALLMVDVFRVAGFAVISTVVTSMYEGRAELILDYTVFVAFFALLGVMTASALDQQSRLNFVLLRSAKQQSEGIVASHEKTANLLLSVLPMDVITRIQDAPGVPIADSFDMVAMLQSDVVGFTSFSSARSPQQLVMFLTELFEAFDKVFSETQVRKIKTVGDAVVACSIPVAEDDNLFVWRLVEAASRMHKSMDTIAHQWDPNMKIRVGIAVGPAIAGVIGLTRFCFDFWGPCVSDASMYESSGRPGMIHIQEHAFRLLPNRGEGLQAEPVQIVDDDATTSYMVDPEMVLGRLGAATTTE